MSLLTILGLGKQAGDAIATPVEAVGNVLDKLFTSSEEKAAAVAVMEKLRQRPAELQIELNKVEAQNRSWWVAGWRPYIGWICGTSLGLYYIPQFLMAAILWTRLCWDAKELVSYPITSIDGLLELIGGMLGLALLRTVEKAQKVSK
jgi:hypothetical protein